MLCSLTLLLKPSNDSLHFFFIKKILCSINHGQAMVEFTGRPKIQKPKNFTPRCENIIKMIRATFWVLVFAKTQKPRT
jgi:hypothetical protein